MLAPQPASSSSTWHLAPADGRPPACVPHRLQGARQSSRCYSLAHLSDPRRACVQGAAEGDLRGAAQRVRAPADGHAGVPLEQRGPQALAARARRLRRAGGRGRRQPAAGRAGARPEARAAGARAARGADEHGRVVPHDCRRQDDDDADGAGQEVALLGDGHGRQPRGAPPRRCLQALCIAGLLHNPSANQRSRFCSKRPQPPPRTGSSLCIECVHIPHSQWHAPADP
jgi:hypothetical protein